MVDDRHGTVFAEAALSGEVGRTAWVAGLAHQRDAYRNDTFPTFGYTYSVPCLFTQAEHRLTDDITLAASGRVDAHSDFGTRVSPRLSALWRPGYWTVRASPKGGGSSRPRHSWTRSRRRACNGLSRSATCAPRRVRTENQPTAAFSNCKLQF